MAADEALLKNRTFQVFSAGPGGKTHFFAGRVKEGFSQISEMQFELVIQDSGFHIGSLIGKTMRVEVTEPEIQNLRAGIRHQRYLVPPVDQLRQMLRVLHSTYLEILMFIAHSGALPLTIPE